MANRIRSISVQTEFRVLCQNIRLLDDEKYVCDVVKETKFRLFNGKKIVKKYTRMISSMNRIIDRGKKRCELNR